MSKRFYITTAIDYVNGQPHLGHAYEKIVTDVIARARRSLGQEVFFLTGLDEHGQKVQQAAQANGQSPQAYCDELAAQWQAFVVKLGITNDDFIRTGQSMEKLVDSKLISAVIDVTTTEVADEIVGGVLSAGPERMDAIARSGVPYVGSCGALDMVNFWAMDTVPTQFRGRRLHRHNANVTLMRSTPEENKKIGQFIAAKLNLMQGPVRFVIPEGGVSGLDRPEGPFWDPAADKALFDAIAGEFRPGPNRKLVRLPLHINDPAFAPALVAQFLEIAPREDKGTWPASRVTRS